MRNLGGGKYLFSSGEVFTISLPENPTTGFSWDLQVTKGLEILDDQYVRADTGMLGAGGKHIWRVKANEGYQVVYAIYRRPWEPLTGNEKTLIAQIFIQ